MKKLKLTCAHAIVKHLIAQKILIDGKKQPLFPGVFGIFGHGNVACLGQALEENKDKLPTYRGHHEQNMALTGVAYSRAKRRKQIFIATSSVGPGSTNLLTAAAVAMSNRIPILFLPGDTYANRMPDPVLQQVEHFNNPGITANDAFKSVTRYFDRITRPEQILQSLPQAIQLMIDPADAGPACLSLCQDTQGETFDYPEEFFKERVHNIRRPKPDDFEIKKAAEKIKSCKNPIIISGGGVFYSDAMEELGNFAIKHNIPVTQTVMGYSTMKRDHSHFLGPIGGLGGKAANNFAKKTDLAIAEGQGALNNMFYSGVTLGLLHGCMPDYLILTHELGRELDVSNHRIPKLSVIMQMYIDLLKPFKESKFLGINLLSFVKNNEKAMYEIKKLENRMKMPVTDLIRFGDRGIIRNIINALSEWR